ncbi:glycosyltransferase family 9 protein [Caproiciproducens galactitolivorans]|uniref:glycosyltransferase family 9 protein n=1 Tax=Caproiciproducens galactitolivorans TaxID=642589 RepID=UPI002409D31F|nr:glycosyltransferase family 9 protein [Caproiciproducens galactitolivorans]
MFTSAALALREFYKDREMTMVCLSISRPVYEHLGVFDRIITVDFRPEAINWDMMDALIAELQDDTYDILLQPQLSKYPIADIIAAAVKCNKRISIEPLTPHGNSSPKWIKMTNFLYDKFIPYPRGVVSEFAYYGAFVRGICGPEYKITMPKLPYGKQNFVSGDYYVLYPGGSLVRKFWPADRYAKIAEHIYDKTGLTGVILGAANEQWVSDNLKSHLNTVVKMSIIDLTGKTSMSDVIDLIGNAKFIVSNDTSGVHIAAATNTPSVVNVGGWHFKRFLPYGVEDVKPDEHLPLVAYKEMPCYYCTWDWDIVGEKNPECLECLKDGHPCVCIQAVSVEQMTELVDQVIQEVGL